MAIAELGREKRDNLAAPLANIAFDLFGLALAEVGPAFGARAAHGGRCACTGRRRRCSNRSAIPSSRRRSSRRSRAFRCACSSASSRPKARALPATSSSSACCAAATRCAIRAQSGRSITDIALSWGYSAMRATSRPRSGVASVTRRASAPLGRGAALVLADVRFQEAQVRAGASHGRPIGVQSVRAAMRIGRCRRTIYRPEPR